MARSRSTGRAQGGSRSGVVVRRMLGYAAFLPLAGRAPMYARLIAALVQDRRMPKARTALLAGAAGYLVLGRDLIPDDIPVIGGLDDLVVVVLAVELFLDGVPPELLNEKLHQLGIEPAAFEQDIAQIRRLTPKPVRRVIRRVPRAVEAAGQAIKTSGLGPRTRAWLNREGNPA